MTNTLKWVNGTIPTFTSSNTATANSLKTINSGMEKLLTSAGMVKTQLADANAKREANLKRDMGALTTLNDAMAFQQTVDNSGAYNTEALSDELRIKQRALHHNELQNQYLNTGDRAGYLRALGNGGVGQEGLNLSAAEIQKRAGAFDEAQYGHNMLSEVRSKQVEEDLKRDVTAAKTLEELDALEKRVGTERVRGHAALNDQIRGRRREVKLENLIANTLPTGDETALRKAVRGKDFNYSTAEENAAVETFRQRLEGATSLPKAQEEALKVELDTVEARLAEDERRLLEEMQLAKVTTLDEMSYTDRQKTVAVLLQEIDGRFENDIFGGKGGAELARLIRNSANIPGMTTDIIKIALYSSQVGGDKWTNAADKGILPKTYQDAIALATAQRAEADLKAKQRYNTASGNLRKLRINKSRVKAEAESAYKSRYFKSTEGNYK